MEQETLLSHDFDSILVQKLQFDSNIASFLLISCPRLVHFELRLADLATHRVPLRHLKLFKLVSVSVVLDSALFVVGDCIQGVLKGFKSCQKIEIT